MSWSGAPLVVCLVLAAGLAHGAAALNLVEGTTLRASVNDAGEPADGDSAWPVLSANGRFVAFQSEASNLAPGATGSQVYLRDLEARTTTLVSRNAAGEPGNGPSFRAGLSADGRHVVFVSAASNLDPRVTDRDYDVYIHDAANGTTSWIGWTPQSLSRGGILADISGDGESVVAYDRAGQRVVVVDPSNGVTEDVSHGPTGSPLATGSLGDTPRISADGRLVLFASYGAHTSGDTDPSKDLYLYDRAMGTMELLTGDVDREVLEPLLSATGRHVAFTSFAAVQIDPVDVHVLDRAAGAHRVLPRVADGYSDLGLSDDGRHVAFFSRGSLFTGLMPILGIWVWEHEAGTLSLATIRDDGSPAVEPVSAHTQIDLSADGGHVAFYSDDPDMAGPGDDALWDVFVRIR